MMHATPLPSFQQHNVVNKGIYSKEIDDVALNGVRNEVDMEIGITESLTDWNGSGPSASNLTDNGDEVYKYKFINDFEDEYEPLPVD